MNIRDLPEAQRPQEKLLYSGAASLTTAELLALIIRTGTPDKSAVQLAEEVIAYTDSHFGSLVTVDPRELQTIDGIGASKACSIVAGMELARRLEANYVETKRIRSGRDVYRLVEPMLRHEKKEHVIELILNAKCEVEAQEIISIGELSTASVHPREVFSTAIRKSAAGIIIVHNHPSGDPTPSEDDIAATHRLIEVSNIVGIKLIDHVIVGRDTYVSLKEEGVIRL